MAQDIRISEPAWWDWSYRQVIRFCQPQEAVQQFLAERDDAHMNYAELARDYILESEEAVIERQQFVQKHFVQRWHRNRPLVVFDNGNYSTGYGKRRGTSFLIYGDQYSKVTGEFPCLHFEVEDTRGGCIKTDGADTSERFPHIQCVELLDQQSQLPHRQQREIGSLVHKQEREEEAAHI